MSNAFLRTTAGTLPPSVATQYTASDATTAVPAANNLNLFAVDSTTNNDNGITSTASGSTVTTLLTNRIQNTGSTNGAVNLDVTSFSLGATPAVFTFETRVSAFTALTVAGGGWSLFGAVRTDGITATLVPSTDKIESKEAAILAADVNYAVSGNSFVVRVTGVAGVTDLNWSSVGLYTRVI